MKKFISIGTLAILTFISSPLKAQDASVVADIAKKITVRIEGATQGSGVLVKQNGDVYTVITALHVVSGQVAGEELAIYTYNGNSYPVHQGSIKKIGTVDLAVLTFSSPISYKVAKLSDVKSVLMGNPVYVSGFPLPTSSVPHRILRFLGGQIIANATVPIPKGYQLLYSNPTLPGMSGGAVLNVHGGLVGIHAIAERDDQVSVSSGKAVATGTNQAVPITHYSYYLSGNKFNSNYRASTADDFLTLAVSIINDPNASPQIISLTSRSISLQRSSKAYFYRAVANLSIGKYEAAILDLDQSISIEPSSNAFYNRGHAKYSLGNYSGAISDFDIAISITPNNSLLYYMRGLSRHLQLSHRQAINDFDRAIQISQRNDSFYNGRGNAKRSLGNLDGAINDYSQAIILNSLNPTAYLNRGVVYRDIGRLDDAILDLDKSISIDSKNANSYFVRGSIKHDSGDLPGAVSDYDSSILIDNQHPAAYYSRAYIRTVSGDHLGALADLEKSISINPSNPNSIALRALVKFKVGNISSACIDWQFAETLGSTQASLYLNELC